MNELDVMKHAKSYIDLMARGIDPLTGNEIPENDTLNNVRLSRCLFYVSDILRQVIENGGVVKRNNNRRNKIPFYITNEQLKNYEFSSDPLSVSQITQRINGLIDNEVMKKLRVASITTFLVNSEILKVIETSDGRTQKVPTEYANQLGITTEWRMGQYGEYRVVTYNKDAQQLIIDNINSIISIDYEPPENLVNQWKIWTDEDDAKLTSMYEKNMSAKEIGVELKRSSKAIKSRIRKLGLMSIE